MVQMTVSSYTELSSGSNTYTLQSSDVGKNIRFSVEFTDDRGNLEISGKYGHTDKYVELANNPASYDNITLTAGDHTVGKTG